MADKLEAPLQRVNAGSYQQSFLLLLLLLLLMMMPLLVVLFRSSGCLTEVTNASDK